MEDKYLRTAESFPGIRNMLKGIDKNIWYIFLPSKIEDFSSLEDNIKSMRRRERVRNQVMSIQRLCGFELRPNEPLQETKARARIAGMKRDRIFRRHKERRPDDRDI